MWFKAASSSHSLISAYASSLRLASQATPARLNSHSGSPQKRSSSSDQIPSLNSESDSAVKLVGSYSWDIVRVDLENKGRTCELENWQAKLQTRVEKKGRTDKVENKGWTDKVENKGWTRLRTKVELTRLRTKVELTTWRTGEFELIIVKECNSYTITINIIEILFARQSVLSLSRILPFGGIGNALLKNVHARILKKLIKLRASEHLRIRLFMIKKRRLWRNREWQICRLN